MVRGFRGEFADPPDWVAYPESAEDAHHDGEPWSVRRAVLALGIAGATVGLMSEILVGSISEASEDIGLALYEKFPTVDPLTIRFTDLRQRVLELDGFDDDPKTSNEPKLEAIQMAWYEEWKENQG